MAGEYNTEALDRHFQAIGKRLDHLEEQLKRIANAGGVQYATYAETNDVPDEVVQLAQAGDRLGAIKRLRELTGANFGQATEIVDAL
jgi:ribosomal protein L7/L12